jgi:predicted phosphodiesterase
MRVLILSDIHANLIALETVLSDAAGEYDTIWCLGDVVGYGPRPNECIDLMRSKSEVCVMGNHDWAVLGRPGISVDDFNPQARQAVMWTRAQLTADNVAYLDKLVDTPLHPSAEEDILITHASPREPVWEYILTPTTALENFAFFEESICLVGHTHKPAIFRWRLQEGLEGDAYPATVQYLQPVVGMGVHLETSPTQR